MIQTSHRQGVFNFHKVSLCMVSGLRGLRHYLERSPEIMKNIWYLDIVPDKHAVQSLTPPWGWKREFDWSSCKIQLCELPDLRLITLRDMPNRYRYVMYPSLWNDYEGTLQAIARLWDCRGQILP